MNLIITSNPIRLKDNIHDYVDNFEIVCVRERSLSTMRTPTDVFQYDVWYHDGMDIEEETSDQEFQFHYYPTDVITTALDEITELIVMIQEAILNKDEDDQEELNVIVICEKQWNKDAVQYIKRKITECVDDIDDYPNVMDLYQYLKINSKDDLAQIMKMTLNTEFIYPDDPIAFGYAIYQTLKHYI